MPDNCLQLEIKDICLSRQRQKQLVLSFKNLLLSNVFNIISSLSQLLNILLEVENQFTCYILDSSCVDCFFEGLVITSDDAFILKLY